MGVFFHAYLIIFIVMHGQIQYITRQFLRFVEGDRRANGQAGIAPNRRPLLVRPLFVNKNKEK